MARFPDCPVFLYILCFIFFSGNAPQCFLFIIIMHDLLLYFPSHQPYLFDDPAVFARVCLASSNSGFCLLE